MHNIVEAHAWTYEVIHAIRPQAKVGITDQWLYCKPDLNAGVTRQFEYFHQDWLINALVKGEQDLYISANVHNWHRVRNIPAHQWSPHLDFFGLQYYKSVYPYDYFPVSLTVAFLGGRVDLDLKNANYPHKLLNDMGWEVSPEGLYECLMRYQRLATWQGKTIPVLIAENGTAERVDRNRAAYITAHIEAVKRAQADGVPVLGYLHWSISDNWEWIDGYRPEARFGLFSVDLPTPSPAPRMTYGALAYWCAASGDGPSFSQALAAYGR
jgi:beta-glucosidase/6-phospho-beta-glucosidase/beta-galactosidase